LFRTIHPARSRSTAGVAAVLAIGAAACGSVHSQSGASGRDAAVPTDGPEIDASVPVEDIHFIGRFDRGDPSAPVFEWSGSAIWTRFSGTTISAELDGSANNFEIEVDGVRQPVLVHPDGDQTHVLASRLPPGEHDLKLTRRTEAFLASSKFRGFPGATLISTPAPTRLIEMIGDSITCGYGIIGAGPNCTFSPDTEAETHAYGALAAAQVGAAHHSICWSGIGVSRNFADEAGMLMPARYGLTLPDEQASPWDFSTTPQVVVINLGTDDFSNDMSGKAVDPGDSYVNAMIAFISQIRGHYRTVPIILATSPMLDGDAHAAQRRDLTTAAGSDPNTSVIDFPIQQAADGYGCDFHPSDSTAQKMADQLQVALHDLLGW
jgi:lysophospholipase L1-like esterase